MSNLKLSIGAVFILAFGLIIAGGGALGATANLLAANYYLISIGTVDTSIATIIHTAQTSGYTVIVRSGDVVHAYRGATEITTPGKDLLNASPLLYVDDGQFLMQVRGEDYDYAVRPGEGTSYTLVVVPHKDLPLADTLTTVITALQKMNVVGSEVNMEFQTFPQHATKTPAPPAGVPIDSRLYAVMVAPDWFTATANAGLTRVGLRVEVVAEKLPNGDIPMEFRQYIESETTGLAKLLLPINKLVDLARAPTIGYLRPPYQPHPATP